MKGSAGIVYRVDALKAVSARSGAFWGVLVDVLHDDDTEGGVEAVRGRPLPVLSWVGGMPARSVAASRTWAAA